MDRGRDSSIAAHLRGLEELLLDAAVRRSPERVGELLHPGFVEIGSSGRAMSRAEVIEGLGLEAAAERAIDQFEARMLAPSVALVTYRVRRRGIGGSSPAVCSLRSSVWVLGEDGGGAWRMIFHQGTVVGEQV